jgi:GT2 family glycosyltransferase
MSLSHATRRLRFHIATRGVPTRIQAPVEPAGVSTVTIVIPCYNYGRYLPECVRSALDQRRVAANVIIIDDASTDDSLSVAQSIAESDPRVAVHQHRRNKGHIQTYNEGLEAASGEYVVLLSADDRLAPGSLSRATALLSAHPEVGFAYGQAVRFTDADPLRCRDVDPLWAIWHGDDWAYRRWSHGRNCILSPEVVMRTSVQRKIGGYRPDFPHTGDADMWMRAASVADVGYLYGVDQAYYRLHSSNMHQSEGRGEPALRLADMRRRVEMFELLAHAPSPTAMHLEAAKRAIAFEAMREAVRQTRSGEEPNKLVEEFVGFAVKTHPDASSSCWSSAIRAWRKFGCHWPTYEPVLGARIATSALKHRSRRRRLEAVGAW